MIIFVSILAVLLLCVCIYQFTLLKKRDKILAWISSVVNNPNPFNRTLDRPYSLEYDSVSETISIFFNHNAKYCPPNVLRCALHHVYYQYPHVKKLIFQNLPNQTYARLTFMDLWFTSIDLSKLSYQDCDRFHFPLISSELPCTRLILPFDTPSVDFSDYNDFLEELVIPGPYIPAVNVPEKDIYIRDKFTVYVMSQHIQKYIDSDEWYFIYFFSSTDPGPIKIDFRPIAELN